MMNFIMGVLYESYQGYRYDDVDTQMQDTPVS